MARPSFSHDGTGRSYARRAAEARRGGETDPSSIGGWDAATSCYFTKPCCAANPAGGCRVGDHAVTANDLRAAIARASDRAAVSSERVAMHTG